MYRLGLEGILGVRREDGRLRLKPSIPAQWSGFRISYRCGEAIYEIAVQNDGSGNAVAALEVDGERLVGDSFPLVDDGATHQVRVRLGQQEPAPSAEKDS
jgi:cyclic beta-1,2-glucan synthetase